MNPMSDDEFVTAFLNGTLPPAHFHHRDHLRLAWTLIQQQGEAAATQTITTSIRAFAIQHGQSSKYHDTLTRFWLRLVGHLIATQPDITTFADFLAAFPQILDKDLPYRHWRRETMSSAHARMQWVEPDILAMPA